jgi:uncharacterized protein
VLRGLGHLQRAGVEWNALVTLHNGNAQHPLRLYRYLRDELGARHIQFIPIVERTKHSEVGDSEPPEEAPWSTWRDRPLYTQTGESVTARSVTGAQLGSFLTAIFDEWVRRDVGTVFVQAFDVALANWIGAPPSLCVHAEICGLALALEHTGDLYSCDHFVEPAHLLGNIADTPLAELVVSEQQIAFGQAKRDTLPQQCLSCEVRFACHGGCPKDRLATTADGEKGLNVLCDGYLAFFRHIDADMRTMCHLIRQGRAPAEIMRLPGRLHREL